ncbi:cytochrome c3 family protein [uncultured Desulfuromonas sp.]|uniref:cytochrome c3 family protein n=1 Tax=uncultured Desulfuromonas sp. TaxID=181013 RepID=UPI002AABB183|nr:cytochrome c3 family protein [uncultured Desulfuromonas sp.]
MKRLLLCYAAILVALMMSQTVWAMETEDCLGCHTEVDEVGEDYVIAGELFAKTAHAEEGCAACHEVGEEHPDDGVEAELVATCADCHDEVTETYNSSVHAENAECRDCHNAHQALAPVSLSGVQMNESCQDCHGSTEVEETHARWLPQADVHIRSVPCVSCHSSSEKFVITLYVTQRQGNRAYADYELLDYQQLAERTEGAPVSSLLDIDENGEVSLDELSTFYKNGEKSGLRLWAMMTPETVEHNFTTMDNRWDCTYCHAAGPEAMQHSYAAFPAEDGSYQRVPMEQGATLDALFGTPDFYMVGSTRSKVLNIVGLLILLGGFAMPIGHGTLRFLTRKNRKKEH